jgi:hypothetical protein
MEMIKAKAKNTGDVVYIPLTSIVYIVEIKLNGVFGKEKMGIFNIIMKDDHPPIVVDTITFP